VIATLTWPAPPVSGLVANGVDAAIVWFTIVDAAGAVVPWATNALTVSVSGGAATRPRQWRPWRSDLRDGGLEGGVRRSRLRGRSHGCGPRGRHFRAGNIAWAHNGGGEHSRWRGAADVKPPLTCCEGSAQTRQKMSSLGPPLLPACRAAASAGEQACRQRRARRLRGAHTRAAFPSKS
jgi:hypothetical protein